MLIAGKSWAYAMSMFDQYDDADQMGKLAITNGKVGYHHLYYMFDMFANEL